MQSVQIAEPANEEPRLRRRDKTRSRICAAARDVFMSHGFQAATIEQIALAAGTRRSTLYNHFRDKNEILAAISDDFLEGLADLIHHLPPRPSRQEIDSWIADFAEFSTAQPTPTTVMVHFSSAIDAPPAAREFGGKVMAIYAAQLPAFAEALLPGNEIQLARAHAVLRELGWALCSHVENRGGGLSAQMLEVSADLFERFVKGWR